MYHVWMIGVLLVFATIARGQPSAKTNVVLRDFPSPKLATDDYGQPAEVTVIRILRELQLGGVHSDALEAVDSDYVLVANDSPRLMAAWLESVCQSVVGIDLPRARERAYDGTIYANLLEVATNIAVSRRSTNAVSIPVGVMTCVRRRPWGELPGDGARDAYVVLATNKGFVVFDPPTRQISPLADYPNNADVIRIRL